VPVVTVTPWSEQICGDAQAVVTAIMGGDRDTAALIALEHDHPVLLAVVCAELCAHVHRRWADSLCLPAELRELAWQEILMEVG
jgi:hypothetical protein